MSYLFLIAVVLLWGANLASATCGLDSRQVVIVESLVYVAICTEDIFRVFKSNSLAISKRQSLVAVDAFATELTPFKKEEDDDFVVISTSKVTVKICKKSLLVTFESKKNGSVLFEERFSNVTATHAELQWKTEPTEGIYGGGQYVNGFLNYRSAPVRMIQFNTEAVVPFFISSKGYGLLWDEYGDTMLNPPQAELVLQNNESIFTPESEGDYWFYIEVCGGFGCGSDPVVLTLENDHESIIACEHQIVNIPNRLSCRVRNLRKGTRYTARLATPYKNVKIYVTADLQYPNTGLRSESTSFMDYYFIASGAPEDAIRGYRKITGSAELYARWVYAFWQCREHYGSQEELLTAARKFRQLKIPVDNIVQDWLYWGDLGWGPQWDPKVYPDPKAMVDELKSMKMNLMVSVWSKFDKKTKFYKELNEKGMIMNRSLYMDPWNPGARSLFYKYSKDVHFDIGVDALWLDATEPEGSVQKNKKIYLGDANEFLNTYSLATSLAVHAGLRHDYPERRIFSLTRSSFAGQQRYGATLWSGDTSGTWDSLRRQITMSINYQLSGIPTWSMDIGGFFRPDDQYKSADYFHLLTRWFQFGCFVPVFRVHGAHSHTELWNYGEDTMNNIINSAVHFRYRLLDYIYSGFYRVETEGYTMQRGLILDYSDDAEVYNIPDQFMFGPSFMVAPIYTPDSSRRVYLPSSDSWTNFFTGEVMKPGWHDVQNSSIVEIPLYVRSSIVVLSPFRQYVSEKLDQALDRLEVRIYQGSDAEFVIYEDDGVSRSKKQPRQIKISWHDSDRVVTIDDCVGSGCKNIPAKTLDIVLVRSGVGTGIECTDKPDDIVEYVGKKVEKKLQVQPIGGFETALF